MYCKNCGAQKIDGSKFCRNCGQEIEAPRVAKPIYTTKKPPIPKKKKHGLGKFLKFVIFSLLSIPILVLIILLVVSISKDVRAKSDTAKNLAEIDPGKSIEKLIENTVEYSLLADSVAKEIEETPSTDTTPALTQTLTYTPTSTLAPTQDNSGELKDYPSPIFETEVPLHTVLTNDNWELAGVAHNPNKIGGDNVVITLESLNGYIVNKEIVTAFIGGMIWEI